VGDRVSLYPYQYGDPEGNLTAPQKKVFNMPGKYSSNVEDLKVKLALIRATIASGVFSDVLVAGLNAGMGIMKRRIFNQSLAADGTDLGPYFSEDWARHRRLEGRQVARKDLEMEGTLRRAIEVVSVNNTRAEIRITDDESADIARFQETQIFNLRNNLPANQDTGGKVPIFELSEVELEIVQSTTKTLLEQKFNF
jgi:hypothetical protein